MKNIELLLKYEPKFKCLRPVNRGHETKCWEWTMLKWSNGYGRLGEERTHRIAYEIIHGDIDKGKSILHKCDNKLCCRPDHLYVGTHGQNMKDYVERGAEEHSGEKSMVSVLSEQDVLCIRWLYEKMSFSLGDIASIYNIGKSTVDHIISKRTWKRLNGEFKPTRSTLENLFKVRNGTKPRCTLNFRNDKDLDMVAGLITRETQEEVYKSLSVSRGSVRSAVDRSQSPMNYSDACTRREKYLKWIEKRKLVAECLPVYKSKI